MSTKSIKEVYKAEFKESSEKELFQEEIINQQILDIFVRSDNNWCLLKII